MVFPGARRLKYKPVRKEDGSEGGSSRTPKKVEGVVRFESSLKGGLHLSLSWTEVYWEEIDFLCAILLDIVQDPPMYVTDSF